MYTHSFPHPNPPLSYVYLKFISTPLTIFMKITIYLVACFKFQKFMAVIKVLYATAQQASEKSTIKSFLFTSNILCLNIYDSVYIENLKRTKAARKTRHDNVE